MKLMVQAVQAVTVELLGVLLVVWMLFGFASWGLHSAGGQRATWHRQLADAALAWTGPEHHATAAVTTAHQQQMEYVAQRLNHYGEVLQAASQNAARRAWQDAISRREVPVHVDPAPAVPQAESL